MQLVDTNIFIRFLTKDDPKKAASCLRLFEAAAKGKVKLYTIESIIAEVVYILSSKQLYHLSREKIAESLDPILRLRKLTVPYKTTILRALVIYRQNNVDFEDALLVAHLLRIKTNELYSYDRGFDRIPDLKRLEP